LSDPARSDLNTTCNRNQTFGKVSSQKHYNWETCLPRNGQADGWTWIDRLATRRQLYDIVVRFADQEYIYFMEFQEYIYFMGSWSDRRTWLDRENIYTLWGRKYIYWWGRKRLLHCPSNSANVQKCLSRTSDLYNTIRMFLFYWIANIWLKIIISSVRASRI